MILSILVLSFVLKISRAYILINENSTGFGEELESVRGSVNPDSVDWRTDGHVSPVKDQGKCEACWAFGVVGAIESHQSIYLKRQTILSEQFLIDCLESSPGCEPMSLVTAYTDVIKLGGVLSDKNYYPYEERKRKCRWKGRTVKPLLLSNEDKQAEQQSNVKPSVLVIGMQRVKPNEDEIAKVVSTIGPVTAAINPKRMIDYHGSYIDEPSTEDCDPDDLGHTVTIVGYSSSKNKKGRVVKYWIIKNSWGEDWGSKGYYYLVRGRNACGIANDVVFPVVAK